MRLWLAGQEAGSHITTTETREGKRILRSDETLHLERMGMEISQKVSLEASRDARGNEVYDWTLQMSAVPMKGKAFRHAGRPQELVLRPQGGTEKVVPIPAGALVWPEDLDQRLREAARTRTALQVKAFAFALQQWNDLDLTPVGPEPLPGFVDTVKFRGRITEGGMALETTSWISPTQGEVRQSATLMGIPMVLQRAELPAPKASGDERGFFDQTLSTLPPHPFLPWIEEVTLAWSGPKAPPFPEDPQQRALDARRISLKQAAPPTPAEAAERPVSGKPSAEDAPFLAPTPLVQYQDPCFENLVRRIAPRKDATRWELAQAVTHHVFEWIRRKDMSVGFATALEVCRDARGDCTEHGVLAVALLRRLGVPARAATGWVALETTLGLHFWVEVRIGQRWIPVDPTFDQAPASALRIKLGTADLSDLGTLGWDAAATAFNGGQWKPEAWLKGLQVAGNTVRIGSLALRLEGAALRLSESRITARFHELDLQVRATTRPGQDRLDGTRLFQGPRTQLKGHYDPASGELLVELPEGRWLSLGGLDQSTALDALDAIHLGVASRPTDTPSGK